MKRYLLTGVIMMALLLVSSATFAVETHGKTVSGGKHYSVTYTGAGKPYGITADAASGWEFEGSKHITNTLNWYADSGSSKSARWGKTKSTASDVNNELFSVRISGTIVPVGPGDGPPPPTDWSVEGTFAGDFQVLKDEETALKGQANNIRFESLKNNSPTLSSWEISSASGEIIAPDPGQDVSSASTITIGNAGGHYSWSSFSGGKYWVKAKENDSSQEDDAILTVIDIKILRNGNNITDETNDEVVGHQIALVGEVTPSVSISAREWTIPGNKVEDYTVATNSTTINELKTSELNDASVIYFWIDDKDGREVKHSVTINGVTYEKTTTFNVEKPPWDMEGFTHGNIAVDQEFDKPGFDSITRLHYGLKDEHGDPGIYFLTDADNPGGFLGEFQLWQVINTSTRTLTIGNETPQNMITNSTLDGGLPYHSGASTSNNRAWDSPGTGSLLAFDKASISDNFSMWLMFKPNGESIWVPLKTVDWFWTASCTKANDIWSLDNPGNHSNSPSASDPSALPQWNGLIPF